MATPAEHAVRLERAKRQVGILRKGAATLAAIYGRDRNLRKIGGNLWFVTTRQGLIGLRDWLIRSAPQPLPLPDQAPALPAPAPLPQVVPEPAPAPPAAVDQDGPYRTWLSRYDPLRPTELGSARQHHASLDLPGILIVAILSRDALAWLDRMVDSWLGSIHGDWTACIVMPLDVTPSETDALHAKLARDPRLHAAATPEALAAARAQRGTTLLCFGPCLLNPLSLYMLGEAAARTGAGVVYSDHDHQDEAGQRRLPAFKPQFSPEYLARYNYVGNCVMLSGTVPFAGDLSGLTQAGFDSLVARLAQGQQVEHVPFTLFHVPGEVHHQPHDRLHFPDEGPGVAIIIPTRDGLQHLQACVASILERTSYHAPQLDIVIVDNGSVEPETLDYLRLAAGRPNVSVVPFPAPFNFAEINNVGARSTTRDILVFLNNDTVVHDPAWLSKLVAYAKQPGVGMVGAKLLFPDGTIQHGGCVAGGSSGTVQHLLSYRRPEDVAATDHTREMSVVTGACVAVRRDVFMRVGGFDPILQITWNDVKACLECITGGLRNLYVADPLLIHDESKTRGHDDTRDRYNRYFSEADYTRRRFRGFFSDDPSYNPNLSLEQVGDLADPPRVRRPWSRSAGRPVTILVLSVQYRIGFGVPVVIQQQVKKLREHGYGVVIGGPLGENEIAFPGCDRVPLGSVKEALAYAYLNDVSLVISHTPPFFEMPILIGGHIPVLAYDYGEPTAHFFQEPTRSYLLEAGYQKRAAAALTTTIATISQAVKDETLNKDALVVGLANSHLPAWSEASRPDREAFRKEQAWEGRFVVLTVCRFYVNERDYKGLDKIASILREFPYLHPEHKPVVWALAGAGHPADVEAAEQLGFTVFPNVSDETLAALYRASDAYMSFSKWEGYNLGISQALAMGLPTLGSDIPAHREFPIETTHSTLVACRWLATQIGLKTASTPERRATVYDWNDSTEAFLDVVNDMLDASAQQIPRSGASGRIWQDSAA